MNNHVTRRDALKFVGATAVLGGLGLPKRAVAQPAATARQRVLRIAHLTDIHVQPERRANEGMIACLQHVQSLKDKPHCIFTGGDHIMDSFESGDARTKLQWDMFSKILADECSLPVKSCIGNHDIWGWNKTKSKTTGDEPNYGKKRSTEMLRLNQRFHSFDLGGEGDSRWHFVFLDSIQQLPEFPDSYRCFLDEEQYDWLERDLAAVEASVPIAIVSHAPIMCASASLWGPRQANGDTTVRGSRVHMDAPKLKELFARHRNVKLCMSGHMHHVERIDYNGVSYCGNGAVSGNWWKGRHRDCDEGYAVIDLYDDGSFDREYKTYGWKADV